MDDTACYARRAEVVQQYFQTKDTQGTDWPTKFPDLVGQSILKQTASTMYFKTVLAALVMLENKYILQRLWSTQGDNWDHWYG